MCAKPRLLSRFSTRSPDMPERGMPQVVPQGDGLCQVLIEAQRPRNGARNLHDLQRMRHALAEMSPLGAMKTCVLCFRRRKELECRMRSRSLAKQVRMGTALPAACALWTAWPLWQRGIGSYPDPPRFAPEWKSKRTTSKSFCI